MHTAHWCAMWSVVSAAFNKRLRRRSLMLKLAVTNFPYYLCRTYATGCKPPPPTPSKTESACGAGEKGAGGGKTKHNLSFKPYVAPCYTDHDHKNMGLKRPMSPHLTIYAPTLPAMTSIAQRITGIILTFYAFSISCSTLFLSNGIDSYVSIIQSLDLSRPLLLLLKILIGIPFAYHYFFGIRFIAWNAGKWLDMKQVYSSAKNMGIAAVVVVLLFAML